MSTGRFVLLLAGLLVSACAAPPPRPLEHRPGGPGMTIEEAVSRQLKDVPEGAEVIRNPSGQELELMAQAVLASREPIQELPDRSTCGQLLVTAYRLGEHVFVSVKCAGSDAPVRVQVF